MAAGLVRQDGAIGICLKQPGKKNYFSHMIQTILGSLKGNIDISQIDHLLMDE